MGKFYYSIFGPLIEDYVQLKRNLGYKYEVEEKRLARLDKFLTQKNLSELTIPKVLADDWCKKNLNESNLNHYYRVEILRQFSMFLCRIGHSAYLPRLPKYENQFVPYIFTREQMIVFFSEADKLKLAKNNRNSIWYIIPTLFRLLYATGIRASEALSLLCSDIDLVNNSLLVHDCKNGKDRMVPISNSLSLVLKDYITFRNQLPIVKQQPLLDALFIYRDGKSCCRKVAYQWFRKVLYKTGIPHGGTGFGPRLHDIRHTFSVHSLAQMAEQGLDLYYTLPILSTYLGHQSLRVTDRYVRLTSEMYPSIIENTNKLCPYLFPEFQTIESDETN